MKVNFRKYFLMAAIFFFSISVANASFSVNDWKYIRNVTILDSNNFAKIILPFDSGNLDTSLSDIRIVNQDNVETPYMISRNSSVSVGTHEGVILNKSTVQNSTQFMVDTGDNRIHTSVLLSTATPNFKRQVKIYSSDKLIPITSSDWAEVINNGYIFKFTDSVTGFTSGKDTVEYPANTSRYLKVVIGSGSEGPILVNQAILSGAITTDKVSYNSDFPVSVYNDSSRHTTEVVGDLGSNSYTTNAMTINSADINYSRRVIVESSNDNKTWVIVGEGSISNIKTPLFSGSSNRVAYSNQKMRYIRMSIINNDNQPLSIMDHTNLEGPAVSIIFKTRTGAKHTLYYGNPRANLPTYDISQISSYIEENNIPIATIGGETLNTNYIEPLGPKVPYTESHKDLLNITLVLLVVIIGLGLIWYLKKYMKKE